MNIMSAQHYLIISSLSIMKNSQTNTDITINQIMVMIMKLEIIIMIE